MASMFIISSSSELVKLNSHALRIESSLSVALVSSLAGVVLLLELFD